MSSRPSVYRTCNLVQYKEFELSLKCEMNEDKNKDKNKVKGIKKEIHSRIIRNSPLFVTK